MDGFHKAVAAELERVRSETGSDFAAMAAPHRNETSLRWAYASGNLNERYAMLNVKSGRGIAGAALRTKRAIVLDRHLHAPDLRKEDAPLLTAERLAAAAAVPVPLPDGTTGVLLLGARSSREYDYRTLERMHEAAGRLCAVFSLAAGNPSAL